RLRRTSFSFIFHDTATTEIYTLSLHDAFRSPRVLQQKVRDTEHVLLENPCRGGVPGRGTPPSVPSGPPPRKAGDTRGYRSGKRPVAASSPYHNPLSLITRFCVL